METLQRLQRRTRTAEELLAVVKTMKSLAAASIRDYQRATDSLEQYMRVVELGFRILLRVAPGTLAQERLQQAGPVSLVIVGSDQGMVGRFNQEIAEHVDARLRAEAAGEAGLTIAIGTRLADHLAAEGVRVDATIELPGSAAGIVPRVQEVLLKLEEWLRDRPAPRVLLAHHRPSERGAYEPTLWTLLPLDAAWLEELRADPWPHRGIPKLNLPVPQLARALVRQHLLVSLQRALAASLAAENGKRLAAMQAAEKNVEERIESLRARYRRRRQKVITSELLEVMAGFEVLESERRDSG